jgi:hypothetical protein
VVPLDYLVPSLHIAMITNMTEEGVAQERLDQLMELEEDINSSRISLGSTESEGQSLA